MNEFLKRNLPPGMEPTAQKNLFIVGNISAFFISFFAFLIEYASARRGLYMYSGGKYLLKEGVKIQSFYTFNEIFYSMFLILSIVMLGHIVYNYAYYHKGSKSIYLMKRLPNGFEMHRRALTVPLLSVAATAAIAIISIFIYFIIYVLATPKICLPHDVWGELWRIF